jgi:hypothetical protein
MEGFKQFANGKKLIICDVQPAYAKNIHFMNDFAKFLENYQDILVLFNGPDLGFEGKSDIARWYFRFGVPKHKIMSMKWHEKGYAFFRDPMDSCWARESIIRIIRYMLRKRYTDMRQLSKRDVKIIGVPELTFAKLEQHFLGIPQLRGIIPKWNGADICGGAFHECLDEVMILIEALRLNINIIHDFTY